MSDSAVFSRRDLLRAGALLAPLSGCVSATAQAQKDRPNIIFVMADDLGYADVSCYGRRDYDTPAIDQLAGQGMKFTNAYANSAVCSATRLGLITGRYQYRLPAGLEEPIARRHVGLPPDHPTLPSLLQAAGYQTALVGKWHLGGLPDYGPLKSGYDHFWGFRSGGVDYFTHKSSRGEPDLWDGEIPVEQSGYLTNLLGDKAVQMIEHMAGASAPFLLSLHFSAPHWPWEDEGDTAESERIDASTQPRAMFHADGGSLQTYARMVQIMDAQVGRVLGALARLGIEDNTLIVFTSDNGGERFSDTWPFTGRKTELLEGGIRIPTIVRWPGQVAANSVSDQVTISMDWVPTLLAVAGTRPETDYPSDGMDIGFALEGGPVQERTLFWRYLHHEQRACRSGDWKYLKIRDNEFLFNLAEDPLERANLKARFPELFEDLKQQYLAWDETMLPLDPQAFSHHFTGAELADHFGVED